MLYLPLTKPHPPYSAPEPFYSQISPPLFINQLLFKPVISNLDPKDLPDLRPPDLKGKPDYHQLIRKYRNLTSLDETFFKQLQVWCICLLRTTVFCIIILGSVSGIDFVF